MAPGEHLLASAFQGAAGGWSGRLRRFGFGECLAGANFRDPKLNDFDHISHPLAVAVLVLLQRRCIERDVDQRRNAILSHHFGADLPHPFE